MLDIGPPDYFRRNVWYAILLDAQQVLLFQLALCMFACRVDGHILCFVALTDLYLVFAFWIGSIQPLPGELKLGVEQIPEPNRETVAAHFFHTHSYPLGPFRLQVLETTSTNAASLFWPTFGGGNVAGSLRRGFLVPRCF